MCGGLENYSTNIMKNEHPGDLDTKEIDDIFPNIFSQRTIDELREGVVIEDSPYFLCDCCHQEETDSESEFSDEETTTNSSAIWEKCSRFQVRPYLTALMKFYLEECEYAPFAYLILFSLFGILVPNPLNVLLSITLCLSTVVIKFIIVLRKWKNLSVKCLKPKCL